MDNQQHYNGAQHQEVTVGEWFLSMIIMIIPIVNIIMMFVWAFGSGTPTCKANFFKASLIFTAIIIVLQIVVFILFGAAIAAGFSSY